MAKCKVMIMAQSLSKLCNRYFCSTAAQKQCNLYKKGQNCHTKLGYICRE